MINVKKQIDSFIADFEKKVCYGLPSEIKDQIHNRDWEEDRYACCMDAEDSDFLFIDHMNNVTTGTMCLFYSGCMQ